MKFAEMLKLELYEPESAYDSHLTNLPHIYNSNIRVIIEKPNLKFAYLTA